MKMEMYKLCCVNRINNNRVPISLTCYKKWKQEKKKKPEIGCNLWFFFFGYCLLPWHVVLLLLFMGFFFTTRTDFFQWYSVIISYFFVIRCKSQSRTVVLGFDALKILFYVLLSFLFWLRGKEFKYFWMGMKIAPQIIRFFDTTSEKLYWRGKLYILAEPSLHRFLVLVFFKINQCVQIN